MITFSISRFDVDLTDWLYENIGHGGRWLVNKDGEIEPEDGDAWGIYYEGWKGWYKICILDEQKAALYALRWA